MESTLNFEASEIAKLCRVCLSKEPIVNILDAQYEEISMKKLFQTVFQDKVSEDDDAPVCLCVKCLKSILNFYDAFKKYKESQRIFERLKNGLVSSNTSTSANSHLEIIDIKYEPLRKPVIKTTNADIKKPLKKPVNKTKNAGIKKPLKKPVIKRKNAGIKTKNKSCKDNPYFCCLCKENLTTFEQVIEHFKLNHHYRDKNCMLCNGFSTTMSRHILSHRPKQMVYACTMCMLPLKNKQDFKEHNQQTDHSKRQCSLCEKLVRRKQFYAHFKTWHKDEKFTCELCNKVFTNKNNLYRHYKAKHEGRRYYCDKCPASYTSLCMLRGHIAKIHEKNTTAILNSRQSNSKKSNLIMICEYCGKRLYKNNKKQMALHEAYHKDGHKFICKTKECYLTFIDEEALKRHMQNDHENFTCDHCDRTYFSSSEFKAHSFWHIWKKNFVYPEEGQEVQIVCRICKLQFQDYLLLATHLKTNYDIIMCTLDVNFCHRVFASKAVYYQHTLNDHNKESKTKAILDAKQRRYSLSVQQRPFSCNVCRRRFRTSQQLKIHSRMHTGEKPFECRYCGKKFAYGCSLKGHERLHTGEKPFSCRHCGQRFNDSGYTKKHEAKCVRNKIT